MATETLYPTAVTTPSAGGSSCSGTNTARSCSASSACGTALAKASADHRTFQSPSYQQWWSAVTLYAAWSTAAQAAADRDCQNGSTNRGEVYLQYSTNGGSSWTNFSGFPRGGTNNQSTGTASVTLAVGQNVSNVRVRVDAQAHANACPTGACCYGASRCSCRIDTEANCSIAGWQGGGTSCNPDPCVSNPGCS